MRRMSLFSNILTLTVSLGMVACSSGGNGSPSGTGGQGSGGASSGGGSSSAVASSGGSAGASSSGQAGSSSAGSSSAEAGSSATGGSTAKGGTTTGGTTGKGGTTGTTGTGGSTGATGGASATGGTTGSGGTGPGGNSGADAGADRDGGLGGTGGRSHADAGTAQGGSGGSGGFNPCKASPCKILPLGDSITHGVSSTDDAGYRSALFKLIVAANQSVTFTGSLSNGPSTVSSKSFPKSHEGHDGYTVESGFSTYGTAGISSLIPSPAFNTIPDIVLLHIGTNDLTSSSAKATTSDRLDKLLTTIVGAAPDALIVVAKVVPLGYSSSDWTTYNSKIPGIVQAHAAKGEHIVMVDMSSLPTSQLNGVHPNDQGYATMASIWYPAIKDYLPN